MIWTESVTGPPKRLFRLKKGDLWSISEILAKNDKLWFYLRNYFQWEVWFIFKIKLRCLKGEQRLFCRISSAYKWKLYHVSINESFKKFCTFSLGIFNNSVMKSEWLSTDEHKSCVQINRYEFLKGFIRFTQVYFESLAPCTNWKDFGPFVHG